MTEKTVLNTRHHAHGARMVDFSGWEMPLSYTSQIEEHHAVRQDAGLFDVSHMTVIDLYGSGATVFLWHLLANNVNKLNVPGKALYSCMLNECGGVIDDLIVYFLHDRCYRLVLNCATRDKDLAWIRQHAEAFDVQVQERPDLAMIAVQGPNARSKVLDLFPDAARASIENLRAFFATSVNGPQDMDLFVARTGYTGEDGFEIIVPAAHAPALWDMFVAMGVTPIGLGARDTLRLEAGLNLYGQDMDETVSPWEANLGWTVALDEGRDFIGRHVLEWQQSEGVKRVMVGLILDDKGVLRCGQKVSTTAGEGQILSGTFSPTLGKSIAFARIPVGASNQIRVDIRGRDLGVRVVKYPFVRAGKACAGVCPDVAS